jgi:hypothetical protein
MRGGIDQDVVVVDRAQRHRRVASDTLVVSFERRSVRRIWPGECSQLNGPGLLFPLKQVIEIGIGNVSQYDRHGFILVSAAELLSGAAAGKDAELVPLWVGKYDPALIALADVGVSST